GLVRYIPYSVVLATCNRTEIYTTVHNFDVAASHLYRFLADWTELTVEAVTRYLYTHRQWEAVRHLFRVSSGLDSMILGEEQILGQVRNALSLAQEQEAVDQVLATAFRQAVRTGRRIRTETGISRNAISVSSVAVQLAKSHFDDLSRLRVLVISAGEAGKLATNTLSGQGVAELRVINRSFERAVTLAERVGGEALPFERLDDAITAADFIVTATGAADHVLTRERVATAMTQRGERPLLIVDIAVPRDVEPGVGAIPGVTLYNIDDVQNFAERNMALRAQETGRAEAIIDAEVAKFHHWWRTQEVVPTISALRHRAEAIRADEVAKTLRRMPGLTEEEAARVEAMTKAIVNKMLHEPFMYLKERRDGEISMETVRALFGLEDDPPPSPSHELPGLIPVSLT
ncbi:MAG: glutamyl-tRNA reductase, partial [Chloroflexota bacterium]